MNFDDLGIHDSDKKVLKNTKGVPAVNQDYQMTEMCHELNITLNSNLDFNYTGRDFMVNSGLDFDGVQPEILFIGLP